MKVEAPARQPQPLHTKRPRRWQTGKAGSPRRGIGSAPGGAPRRAPRRRKERQGHSVETQRVASATGVCAAPWPASLQYLSDSFGTNSNRSPFVLPDSLHPSTLSHHLEKLKNEDLVKVRRQGTSSGIPPTPKCSKSWFASVPKSYFLGSWTTR